MPRAASTRSQRRGPVCHRLLVADIAGGHDVPARIDRVEQIRGRDRDLDLVERGIRGNRRGGEMVDLGREHAGGAGFGGGDRDEPGAGAEIEHRAAGDLRGMIEQIAGERLAAGPGEGPEGRRQPRCARGFPRSPARSG